MRKIISFVLMSLFLTLTSGSGVLAEEPSTPKFGMSKTDTSGGRSVKVEMSQGSTTKMNFEASNLDEARNITLGFDVVGSQTDGSDSLPVTPEWFIFNPRDLMILPNSSQTVQLNIMVPPDATPGSYEGIIQAVLRSYDGAPKSSGVKVNLATGMEVKLQVKSIDEIPESGSGEKSSDTGSDADSGSSIYVYIVIAVLVVLLLVYFIKSSRPKKKG